jgi:putative ABC transport system permease protein
VGTYDDKGEPEDTVTIPVRTDGAGGPLGEKAARYGIAALVPPGAAERAGLDVRPRGSYFATERMPTSAEKQALQKVIDDMGSEADPYVEEGYTSEKSVILMALMIFAGVITLGAAGIATGLAQADAEPDLRTLAAVGAPPRVRRTLAGLQCAAVAVMGVVLGAAAGVLPAIGLRLAEGRKALAGYREQIASDGFGFMPEPNIPVVVPWSTLVALLVLVPLGAGLLAAVVTRSRASLVRRAEG